MNADDPGVADKIADAALHAAGATGPSLNGGAAPSPRRRRPEPARTAPHRNAATLLRESVAAAARTPAAAEAEAGAQGPVALGVQLGYQVIEEQILLGQKLAQRLGRRAAQAMGATPAPGVADAAGHRDDTGAAAPEGAVGSADLNDLLDRVVHLYKDLGALCVDAVETLARNPLLRAGVTRWASAGTPDPARTDAAAGVPGGGFALDIACRRRTQVRLDLRPGAGHGAPRVHALHAADPAIPPLTDVRFDIDPALREPVLHLAIGDAQPAATYTGVVVDGAANEPLGTLSVRLLP